MRAVIYAKINMKGIVSQHIMQKGTNMDDMEKLLTIKDVQEHDVDIFVMGDDWKGQFDFLKDYCEVVYLPRTEGISTTKIKEDLKDKL